MLEEFRNVWTSPCVSFLRTCPVGPSKSRYSKLQVFFFCCFVGMLMQDFNLVFPFWVLLPMKAELHFNWKTFFLLFEPSCIEERKPIRSWTLDGTIRLLVSNAQSSFLAFLDHCPRHVLSSLPTYTILLKTKYKLFWTFGYFFQAKFCTQNTLDTLKIRLAGWNFGS